jgi:hypothetical protein
LAQERTPVSGKHDSGLPREESSGDAKDTKLQGNSKRLQTKAVTGLRRSDSPQTRFRAAPNSVAFILRVNRRVNR